MIRKTFILAVLIGSGCGSSAPTNEALAAEIERQVQTAHHDLPLHRYARFYARLENLTVKGVYAYANVGHEPIVGHVDQVVWTSAENLPVIHDGGCAVIAVSFDIEAQKLRSMECNVGDG